VFEIGVLRKIFGLKRGESTMDRRRVRIEKLHDLYSLPDIIRVIKKEK
jgi:hypothetical protein